MGSIASVLQWHCQACGQINPTESVKCLKCGTKRISSHDSGSQKRYFTGDSSSEYASRTEKSGGTTPGSETIVIPTTNNFNRCVFFYILTLLPLLVMSEIIDFSPSIFGL
ncbi:Calpain-D [Papilio machaon]|uniref:Calpain-D n=1 Tax=Papilio machaon TaxID=76193 RepID=A0A0N0PFC9_PAPMA|nr:Calpain-D [Papilio machaon]